MYILEHDYILSRILYYTDIDDLLIFSVIDDKFDKILRGRYFWSLYFSKNDLFIPREDYNVVNDWIDIFKKVKHTNEETLSKIHFLTENCSLRIFDIINFDLIDKIISKYTKISLNDHKLKNPDSHFQIKIECENTDYIISYIIRNKFDIKSYDAKIGTSDLYDIIYSLIYNDFRLLISFNYK